ncbi:MAG TPA: NAD(P)H-binding protein [Dietzia timorensis]|uniref:NAD(P)H-binding protein n=1 Tax=Dietzia timorensis TaxID=499555 RepID=A0A921F2C1_9ACTN|nr:NAD(P)H-binding protein [Dietzia timorensis]HJE89503.1 NAD(P)H-binding protein [Dietzia timorensis]
MRIAVLGATGEMGSKVAQKVRRQGHELVSVSRSEGVDVYTGEGLPAAFAGADVAIDCLNMMSLSAKKASDYFGRTSRNVVDASQEAGVSRLVCMSIAGAADPEVNKMFGYYKGKAVQERVYIESGADCVVVRSTQWFQFLEVLMGMASVGPVALLPKMMMAPVSAERVASLLVETAVSGNQHEGKTLTIRGPETGYAADFVKRQLAATGNVAGKSPRWVGSAPYMGSAIARGGLVPSGGIVDETSFGEYLESLSR